MADIWSTESEEDLEILIQRYRSTGTRKDYLEVLEKAKMLVREKASKGKFQEVEKALRMIWSLPQAATEKNYLLDVIRHLNVDSFWEQARNVWQGREESEKEALIQVFNRFTPQMTPQLAKFCTHLNHPEPIYKSIQHILTKDIDPLVQVFLKGSSDLVDEAQKIFRFMKDDRFLARIPELKSEVPSQRKRDLVDILQAYDTPQASRQLITFLDSSDPIIRKRVLSSPELLAQSGHFLEFRELADKYEEEWSRPDVIRLYQAALLCEEDQVESWLKEVFSKKAGLFGNKGIEEKKNTIIEALLAFQGEEGYKLTGKLLQDEEMKIPDEKRKDLLHYREDIKLKRREEEEAIEEAKAEEEAKKEEAKAEEETKKEEGKVNIEKSDEEEIQVEEEVRKTGETKEGFHREEEPREKSKEKSFPPPRRARADHKEALQEKPSESKDFQKEKERMPTSGGKGSEDRKSKIRETSVQKLSDISEVIEREIANSDTDDLTSDLEELRKNGMLNEVLKADSSGKDSKSTSSPSAKDKTRGEIDLTVRLVKEIYNLDPGRLFNVLREYFSLPFTEGDEVDQHRNKIVLFLCSSAIKDKSTLMFLDYLRTEEKIQLSKKLKSIIEMTLRKEGMFF